MICTVVARQPLGRALLLTVAFPTPNEAPSVAGRFFMARVSTGAPLDRPWDPYLRRALFPAAYALQEGVPLYTLLIPAGDDPGHRWLAERAIGDSVDLLGPAGQGFGAGLHNRALLLVADVARAPLLFPLMHGALDSGARVTLLLRAATNATSAPFPPATILQNLPHAVEARAEPAPAFAAALAELSPWADHVAIALADTDPDVYAGVARAIRANRIRVDAGFAEVMWPGAIPCGNGACLACLAPLAGGGFTRSCLHGPVFDLLRLAL